MQPLLSHGSVALLVDVEPVSVAGRLPVDEHAERHGRVARGRPHHEMDVAGVEAECDPAFVSVQHAGAPADRPFAGEGLLVEPQGIRDGVGARGVDVCVAR
jgi:hypothetical protein